MKNSSNRFEKNESREESSRQFSFGHSYEMDDQKKQQDPRDSRFSNDLEDNFRRYSFDDNGGGYQGL